ncbi:MAG: hypothetical protein ISS28_00135 [Candidatus Cloacimonetes bacterium]|nr:hypothetical protein [Candidatus Cloacimonadota bacterium]MBL7085495.1 hypothetical protein [Candidatus Cloacimonadota bacterium]
MRRQIPLFITFFIGTIILVSEFIPHKPFGNISTTLGGWFLIISGFAIILGQLNLFKVNLTKISRKAPNWQYYIISLVCFLIMLVCGILWGTLRQPGLLYNSEGLVAFFGLKPFDYIFKYLFENLSATMFSLLAFFMASASYRAFRARNAESTLLLVAAVLVMLGRTTIGSTLTGWIPDSLTYLHLPNIANFIMEYLNTAGQRAIMICAGLGVIGSSLRIILGIERSYLGGR